MNLKEIERVVGSIQTSLFRNSNSFSVGMLKSHFKGAGLQFKEHQVYNPGDDVRFIDWKLSAKTSTTFVKTFEEERNIEIYAFLDLSATMFMGYKGVSKLQAAIEVICLLYLLADKSKDKVSAIIYTDQPYILPLSSGHKGIALLVSQLEKKHLLNSKGKVNLQYEQESEAQMEKKLGLIKSLVARRKEVVLLTDFENFDDNSVIEKLLYQRNLHCFKLESPIESMEKMPFSLLGFSKNNKILSRSFTKEEKERIKGRYQILNVSERYLEQFIREML
ncbi:MAG: hypothetical protein CME62_02735 [Halobacteriovoraceae bacterium]|nr:hypothetical protein [Halobacteriovoraceae bacterium]|tara:strand:- start:23 stop:853 length:831 start_codon:yes stop_codon:yes gene_type:complete